MIGARVGAVIGARIGAAIGTDPLGGGVVLDPTSGKGVPLTQAEWNVVFAAAGMSAKTVAHSWGMQDASGNAAATVGTLLTAVGTLDYQQAVAGWTRTAIRFTDNATEALRHAAGTGTDPSTTSSLWFGLIDVTAAPGAVRQMIAGGGAAAASELAGRTNVTNVTQIKVTGTVTAGTSTPSTGGVRPWVLLYDRTGSRAVIYTDQEKVTGTYAAGVTDGNKGFGQGISNACGMDVLLGANFAGANAEWTDAQVKAVLQAMNWTIPW